MNVNEAKEILLQALPELSEPLKSAVEFTLADWHRPNREQIKVDNLPRELWRDVVSYEGLYQVSNLGRVKSFYGLGEKLLTPSVNKGGYEFVILTKNKIRKSCKVHTLVARAFIPNPENKPVVHHRDSDRTNNRVDNLEWVTYHENSAYAVQLGKYDKKDSCATPQAKLTAEDVRYIRANYIPRHREFGANALARKFKVCTNTIYGVVNYSTYKDVM